MSGALPTSAPPFDEVDAAPAAIVEPPPPPSKPSIFDARIEHLEEMRAMADTEADKVKFQIQIDDLKRRRDESY
jgi:hypothetical protein